MILSITRGNGNQGGSWRREVRPPKIDESGRAILREIVTAQPHATLDEVTAEFTRQTELTVNAFRRWAAAGKFEQMHERLRELWRSHEARAPEPTAPTR